jgi:hypothetical protein
VAIAEVAGAARRHHRFHRAVAAGDHEVEGVEVERLDGGREEGQILAIPARRPRQVRLRY